MESARQYFRSQDYDRTLEVLATALKIKPNDPDATALQKEAAVKEHLLRARALAERREYATARQEAGAALAVDADNPKAKAMLADIQRRQEELLAEQQRKHAEEIAAKERQERLNRPKMFLDSVNQRYLDADLFDSHTIISSKSVKEVSSAIVNVLTNGSPLFQVVRYERPHPEVFTIEAKQGMLGGFRQCVIVGGQTKDDETQLIFKVLEYETHLDVNLGLVRLTDGRPPTVAIHPQRIAQMTAYQQRRLREGVQIVTERVLRAIGQTSVGNN
jgi:tetratricopeptide (TPR) repeat protein